MTPHASTADGRVSTWDWTTRIAGTIVFAWCLLAAVTTFLNVRHRPADQWSIAALDVEFRALAARLPSRGTVGYLEAHTDPGSPRAVATYYAAQYALAPLVIDRHPTHELLIVARDTARPGGDPRLDGFVLVGSVPGGHHLYRRAP